MLTPLPFFQNNVNGTVSILKVMKDEGVTRLVFSSTATVYGNRASSPLLIETLPRPPKNPYGQSKLMAEMILEACVKPNNLQSVALRYFNASGADAKSRTGERHSPETHLVPLVIETALGKRAQINIYGDDYDTPDGTGVRDYIHVEDLADGHVLSLKSLLETDKSHTVNLGTGEGSSVLDVLAAYSEACGQDLAHTIAPRRDGDVAVLTARPEQAKAQLGFEAKRSLADMCKSSWEWVSGQRRNTH